VKRKQRQKQKMKDVLATIKSIATVSQRYRRMKLRVDWDAFTPGQFVMVRVPGDKAFIRRPFGIVGLEGGICEICFKVIGAGTQSLADAKEGDRVSVLGPLGNGFEIADAKKHVLVAGGYGIAPIVGLARHLIGEGKECVIGYGAASAEHLLYMDELRSLGCDLRITTEDGSEGMKGLITDALGDVLSGSAALYCCGPDGLLKAVAKLGEKNGIRTQVSLDRFMACGIGLCLGCVCETVAGTNVRACREGPVFDASTIKW
jgi:dihydroorotate dehydrogenase electron transfer subunit